MRRFIAVRFIGEIRNSVIAHIDVWIRVGLHHFIHLSLECVAGVRTQVWPNITERTIPKRHVKLIIGREINFFLVRTFDDFCVGR